VIAGFDVRDWRTGRSPRIALRTAPYEVYDRLRGKRNPTTSERRPAMMYDGTAMTVMVPDATGRANLFAYLSTLKDTAAAAGPSAPAKPAGPKITGPSQAELNDAAATGAWLYASHDHAGSRFVDLKQITAANAKELRPVCIYRSEQWLPCRPARLFMAE
jgi:hypothetical protein